MCKAMHHPERPALLGLAALPERGPFLLFEELKSRKQKKKYKRRRGKKWLLNEEEKTWKLMEKEEPLPEPSEHPQVLGGQIWYTKRANRVMEFLPSAFRSPAFGAHHAVLAVHTLAKKRQSLK